MRSKLVQCPGGHSICTNFRLSNYSREDFIKIVLPHSASLYASKRALFAAFIVNYLLREPPGSGVSNRRISTFILFITEIPLYDYFYFFPDVRLLGSIVYSGH